jgi:S1-C subfamily serine protease
MRQAPDELPLLPALSTQLADAVERVGRAVVQVNGRPRLPSSGTVCGRELVIVADHALERDEELTVDTPDGQRLPAGLVGRDPATDLAVLRVGSLALEEPAAATGPGRVGQFVLALGRAQAHGLMASLGVVSAVSGPVRTAQGAVLDQVIRTDATPYPGFSGGPLMDASGTVLGILTSGLVSGAGLAIPVAIAHRVADALVRQGHVPRAYLGIGTQPVWIPASQRAGSGRERGLLVVTVADGSPAARDGLLLGDLILAVDGHPVEDGQELQARLAGDRVGTAIDVEVLRGGAVRHLSVTLGQRSTGPRSGHP